MKMIIALLFCVNGVHALAMDAKATVLTSDVKVTSFRFLDHSTHFTPGAELCGELVNPTGKPEMIKIVSDPGQKAPGNYYAWAGSDGKFCTLLATYTGNAEVGIQ